MSPKRVDEPPLPPIALSREYVTALKASATHHRALSLELQVKAEVQQAITLKANRAKAAHMVSGVHGLFFPVCESCV